MCRLLESIKLNDGRFFNLPYHEERMARSLQQLFGYEEPIALEQLLAGTEYPAEGLYKCRVRYDAVSRHVEFQPYTARVIGTLQVVEDDDVAYIHKYEDRPALDALFARRGKYDDILVVKQGLVTDSYYANIVFKQGEQWYTPASTLLQGTMRQYLIAQGHIAEKEIRKDDIASFQRFKLINAMVGFDGPEVDVANIYF